MISRKENPTPQTLLQIQQDLKNPANVQTETFAFYAEKYNLPDTTMDALQTIARMRRQDSRLKPPTDRETRTDYINGVPRQNSYVQSDKESRMFGVPARLGRK